MPPAWASGWGEDERHGPWCAIEVGDVVQRLRWITPGVFPMGSPENEEGRISWDGPPCLVSIDSGFWMFDTPCTQALWEAVMGENPSHFKGPDRPVESVSWEQCQEFLTALNSQLDGLQLSLPSEAQWEYACRAGTETARYSENLDAIAWYSANSGHETHAVASKEANSWGLYDMLGNVWEWCADVWVEDYTNKARAEEESASAHRVIRGGSWNYAAQSVRAAFRILLEPSLRVDYLGFRCAEFRPGS
jgi:formylglycine-generating enzyme required for sulfatase activity